MPENEEKTQQLQRPMPCFPSESLLQERRWFTLVAAKLNVHVTDPEEKGSEVCIYLVVFYCEVEGFFRGIHQNPSQNKYSIWTLVGDELEK